jgi:PAS domain S-box-containing protein
MTDADRFALLAAVDDIADGRLTLEDTAARLCELLVQRLADICVVDVIHRGSSRRLAVKATGPDAAAHEAWLRQRPLPIADEPGLGAAVSPGKSQLLTAFPEHVLGAVATDDDDLALLGSLGLRAAIVIPLTARGRALGAMTLTVTERSGRTYTPDDVRLAEVLARRVAMALDNAGLFRELQSIEAQLSTALASLSEAVIIQGPDGDLVYANQAAAEMMGYAAPVEVLAAPSDDLVAPYDFFDEDGSPLDPAEFPGRRVLAGVEAEPLVMRVVDRRTGEQRWRVTKSSAVRDGGGNLSMVVNIIGDITAVKRVELAQRLLARASGVFNSSLGLDTTLERVAELCVPELADWCTVRLPDEQRRHLESVAVAHTDPEKIALAWSTRERYAVAIDEPGGMAEVFRTGSPLCTNDITDAILVAAAKDAPHLEVMRRLAPRAVLIVPMTAGESTVGVLALVSAESGRRFEPEDIELASEIGRRAATAVENARLYTERSLIARTLQESILPEELPVLPGWRTASLYRPAGHQDRVGGDFYDAIPLEGGAWMVVVGDVTGRGAPAAALTAMMRFTLRSIATFTGSAAEALGKLNRDLVGESQLSLCTAVCVVLREVGGRVEAEIFCAGHPLPVLVRDGRAKNVGRFGPMLGAYGDERFEPVTVPIGPGDVLVLYSDGMLDAKGREERFGSDRLHATLAASTSADDAIARCEDALAAFQDGPQSDDVAVLALEYTGAADAGPLAGDRSGEFSRSYAAVPASVRRARGAVAEYAARAGGMNGRQLDDVRLAVSEVVTNSVMHAYGGTDPGDVRVTASVDAGQLIVVVADAGRGYRAPTFNAGAGWGLELVAQVADEFTIAERADGGTDVRMSFRIED